MTSEPRRRVAGPIVLLVIAAFVAVVGWIIVQGPRR
jgi:hypothetical protein